MKRANEILNVVKSKPYFKSVQKYSCYNKLLNFLPPRFKNAIAFFYIKNKTLFGALSHPGYKMELNYNKDLVKALLKEISKHDINCKELFKNVENIEFFVSKFFNKPKVLSSNSAIFYKELAKGEFKINIKDKDLKAILEKIKKDIINNNERD
jgi:hypothetical protein